MVSVLWVLKGGAHLSLLSISSFLAWVVTVKAPETSMPAPPPPPTAAVVLLGSQECFPFLGLSFLIWRVAD